jgi:Leucine-rich repeat (LRR) protein
MSLRELWLVFLPLSDLSPLNGLSLTFLNCGGTNVSDLTPLHEMTSLTTLWFHQTKVSELTPLDGMTSLRSLRCGDTRVLDLAVLRNMPLTELHCDFKAERDQEVLRSIKSLETINDKPAAEFWKEVEEKQSGNKP